MSAARKLKSAATSSTTFAHLLDSGYWPIGIYPLGAKMPNRAEPSSGKNPYGTAWGAERWTIDRWHAAAKKFPGLGVGICLGPGRGPDQCWPVDIEGDGPEAEESRTKLLGGEVIETMGWLSRRGMHQVLIADMEQLAKIVAEMSPLEARDDDGRKKPGVFKSAQLPGLELRLGGYKPDGTVKQVQSVCPPTLGEDGKPRKWNGHLVAAPVPEAFYRTLAGLIVPKAVKAQPEPWNAFKATACRWIDLSDKRDQAWATAALAGELDELASTGQGGRNNRLNLAAFSLGRFVPRYLARSTVEDGLRQIGESIGLNQGEIEATIRSGIEAGMAQPKIRPEGPDKPVQGPRLAKIDDQIDGDKSTTGGNSSRPSIMANEATDDPHRLARVYLDAKHRHPDRTTLAYHNGEFHRWDTAYRPVPIQAVRAALTGSAKAEFDRINLEDIAAWEDAGSKKQKPTVAKVTTALVNNVVGALSGETLLDESHVAPCWLGSPGRWPAVEILPTKNALLHLPSFADGISPHRTPPTPRFFCPYATDYDFEESAAVPTNWLEFLGRLWPEDPDSIASLQEWFGYHLTPDATQEKIGMLIGPKRSGKGTIAKVLTTMIGEANVCNPKFGALGSQFGIESLIGKMAAIITDARITSRTDIAQVVESLLTISGTDRQTIARKHKTDWSGNLPAKFTIISNELPRLADASGALPGRMIIFQLKTSFYGQEDTKLFSTKIRPEMPGILLWAVEGWKRLRDRGRLIQPAAGQQLVEEMEELSSPISVFLRERCIVEPGREIMTTDLYEAWSKWCETMGNKNPGDTMALGRNIRTVMPNLITRNCRVGNGYGRKFMGIDLANPQSSNAF